MTDRPRRVGAVDEQPGLIEQERSRSERIARPARQDLSGDAGGFRVACRIAPFRPFHLAGDAEKTAWPQALLTDADAVAASGVVRLDQVEKPVLAIDDDRAGNRGPVIRHLTLQGKRQNLR